jgi:hypothetical protein
LLAKQPYAALAREVHVSQVEEVLETVNVA